MTHHTANNKWGWQFIALIGFAAMASCSNDKDIKADLTTKAKSDPNFAGVNFTVDKKVVTLGGKCPTPKAKDEVEKAVKSIHILKGIHDTITIAPVLMNDVLAKKQSVDSILVAYPTVMADATDTGFVLKGSAKKADVDKLTADIEKLNIANFDNKINIVESGK